MNFEEVFESINLFSINEYIDNQVQEDYYLEFKTANFPDKNGRDYDVKIFLKMISSFANSNGGMIVWGIDARTNDAGVDAAKAKKPISNINTFETYVKKLEGTVIVPQVQGIKYKKIIENESHGYIVVYIPRSENAPQMANDNCYYKRSGGNTYKCEHYDIIDILNRKKNPNIILALSAPKILHRGSVQGVRNYSIESILEFTNIGKITAKFLQIKINFNKYFIRDTYGLDGNSSIGLKYRKTSNPLEVEYYGGLDIVLHPDSKIDIDKITLSDLRLGGTSPETFIDYTICAEDFPLKIGRLSIPSIVITDNEN